MGKTKKDRNGEDREGGGGRERERISSPFRVSEKHKEAEVM